VGRSTICSVIATSFADRRSGGAVATSALDRRHGTRRLAWIALLVAIVSIMLAGCGGAKHRAREPNRGGSINVAIVDTPNTEDLARLTPSLFTSKSNIKVNYTKLDEGTLRDVVTSDLTNRGGQFDVVMIGPYEAPQYAKDGYITDLTSRATSDTAYELGDIIPSIRTSLSYDGRLYASPFYGESSFLMYRKDVLRSAGLTMPAHPTWNQVAGIAGKLNRPNMAGICLRGKPGWGELGASLTTVLNTFGGTWWSAKPNGAPDKAMVDQAAFRNALRFYANLVRDAGEHDAANASFNECLGQYLNGTAAIWYDATVGAGQLEAANSAVRGRNGYAPAPVERTRASGWLWSWALAIPRTSSRRDLAWRYVAWATGPQYIEEAGPRIAGGWAAIPPGTRRSTYEIRAYRNAARAFAKPTLDAIEKAPINDPGTSRRPGNPGIQYVGIPQFRDVGNQCTEQFAAVIRRRSTIDSALANCQNVASAAVGGP
jgi:polyol transport system substrate-binding protein